MPKPIKTFTDIIDDDVQATDLMPRDEAWINTIISNGSMLMDQESAEAYRTKRRNAVPEGIQTFSPSSISLILKDQNGFNELIGKCSRQIFFSAANIEVSNPISAENIYKMSMGKSIENTEQEAFKRGIDLEDNKHVYTNVFFLLRYPNDPDLNLLGEMDILLVDDGEPIPLEIKSVYGYYAIREIFGNTKVVGRPKKSHFVQAMMYMYALNNIENLTFFNSDGTVNEEIKSNITKPCRIGFMNYVDRSDAGKKTFTLSIDKIPGNDYRVFVNGDEFLPLTIEDIHRRTRYTTAYTKRIRSFMSGECGIDDIQLPPRDSEYQYSDERLKWMRNQNDVQYMNQQQQKEYDKNGKICKGDFQCRFCDYKTFCLGENPYTDDEYPSDEIILEQLKEHLLSAKIEREMRSAEEDERS